MYLIQLLLPLYGNDGRPFGATQYGAVRTELTDRFGGLTAYTRAPAQGVWSDEAGAPKRDDIVVYEVMTEHLDREWWRSYRRTLEQRFGQEELVVRSQEIERL